MPSCCIRPGRNSNIGEQKGNPRAACTSPPDRHRSARTLDVIGSVVGRQRHSREKHFRTRRACSIWMICSRLRSRRFQRKAPQTVIAAEFDDGNARLVCKHLAHAVQPVSRGVAADARIHNAPVQSGGVQIFLQEIREALAWLGAETCAQTIAERNDHRTRIYRCGGWRCTRQLR